MADLTAERLRELLDYNPASGEFRWRKPPRLKAIDDLIAGSRGGRYVAIGIYQTLYYAHRLAWLYVYGEWPDQGLDHINGDGRDNRIVNLRLASQTQNMHNTRRRCDSSTGFKGVFKKRDKFYSQIKNNGRRYCLGTFETPQQAHAAYCDAARELHGKFARS